MRARLRDVPVGTRFETTLTGRRGRVLDFWPDEPRAAFVVFTDDDEGKWLHPEVVVRVIPSDWESFVAVATDVLSKLK